MATVWTQPIFDRTILDVEFAIRKISEWKKYHSHSVEMTIENDALNLQDDGVAYIDNDAFVLEDEGAVYFENEVLALDIDDVYDLKGCLNLADLNRIENNIAYLAETMESFTYEPNIHGKQWTKNDLPNQNDMSRIIQNIRALESAFYSPSNPPTLPTTMLTYTDVNAIEENLHLIKEMLDCMQSSFKKVGTIKSGSNIFLPLRR